MKTLQLFSMRFRLTGYLVVLVVGLSSSVGAATIGLDAIHGREDAANLALGSHFSAMRSELVSAGHTLVNVTDFSLAALDGVDIIMVTQPRSSDKAFTSAQVSDIHNFVGSGRGLLAFAEGGYTSDSTVENFNTLLLPYGATISTQATEGSGHEVTGFVPHPVTSGISTISLDYQRRLVSINFPAIDLTIGSGADDCLAVVDGIGGAGNVVIMSDSAPFSNSTTSDTNIYQDDNLLLLNNATNHIAVPEPSTFALLSLGAFALLGYGRRRN